MLTVKNAAAVVGVTEGHLRKMIGSGKIPARKFGRDWIIDEKELEASNYVKGKHRYKATTVDDYCQTVLRDWIENPPGLHEGWLDDMVDKLVETTCKKESVPVTSTDTVPVAAQSADTACGDEGHEDDHQDISATAEAWATEVSELIEEERLEQNRQKWLTSVGKRIFCGRCGRLYFPQALQVNSRGERVCPSCLRESGQ